MRFFLLFFLLFMPFTTQAVVDGDPHMADYIFEGLVYKKLFNSALYKEPDFYHILKQEGLEHLAQRDTRRGRSYMPLDDHDIELGLMTSDDLNEALQKEFLRKKRRAMYASMARPFALMTGEIVLVLGSVSAIGRYFPGFSDAAMGIVSYVVAEKTIDYLIQMFNLTWYLKIMPVGDPLADLELTYAAKKRFFSPEIQVIIERTFQDARKDDGMGTKKRYLNHVLRLPTASEPLTMKIPEMMRALDGYLDKNDKPILDAVMLAAMHHEARFSEKAATNPIRKIILYLEGPPGLGKSHFVKKLFEYMGLPLISLMLNDDRWKSTTDAPGTFFQGIASQKARNAGLFFDEADRVLNSDDPAGLNAFLKFLDPQATTVFDPYLGAELDISHYFIVLAGNNPLKDKALIDRCLHVHLDKITPVLKKETIYNVILPELGDSDVPSLKWEYKGFPREIQREIDAAIAQDVDPGYRTIQMKLLSIINRVRLETHKNTQLRTTPRNGEEKT